jgi:uncharacterized protein YjbI with pentapeptide repeats
MQNILEGLSSWPAALDYAGDFTNDQWLTLDDITLFKQALVLGSETEFTQAYPTARYNAGDFDGNGLVGASDMAGFIASLQHAGVPLSGASFADQNLTNVHFFDADLTGADLTRADARGAIALDLSGVTTTNLIRPDGRVAGLNLAAGEKLVAYAGVPIPVQVSGGFSIGTGATFDLTDNAAIIDYPEAGPSPDAAIREQIISGRDGAGLGATWNGQGITSSNAATANATDAESRSVGYAENSAMPLGALTTFRGQPVDATSVLITFTRTGDANLDGLVNDDDVTIVGATYAPGVSQPSWALGDFDFNGFVDDDDVTLLGAFYNPSAPPLAATPESSAATVSAVPEPATLVLATLASLIVVATRRHIQQRRLGPSQRRSGPRAPARPSCNRGGWRWRRNPCCSGP